jgi:hypothetical protein
MTALRELVPLDRVLWLYLKTLMLVNCTAEEDAEETDTRTKGRISYLRRFALFAFKRIPDAPTR